MLSSRPELRIIVWSSIGLAAFILLWLSKGVHFTLSLDRLVTTRAQELPTSSIAAYHGDLVIGGQQMTFCGLDNLRRTDLDFRLDASNRVILCVGKRSFALGPLVKAVDALEFQFKPDPGDRLSFSSRRSILSWTTPFEIHWLGGTWPSWMRFVYYKLTWTKASGSTLEMKWRYEQDFYRQGGWREPIMKYNSLTGLVSTEIR